MNRDQLFSDMAKEAADLSTIPTDDESAKLRDMALLLVKAEKNVMRLEKELTTAKEDRKDLAMYKLPDLMKEIGQDKIGLSDVNYDLVLSAYYHANISSDWSEEQRTASFDYLESIDAGDLVKTTLTMQFGRNEIDRARAVVALVFQASDFMERAGVGLGEIPVPVINMSVHWGTLTSFVREQVEQGEVIDLEKLGATVGSIVKIKKRKEK